MATPKRILLNLSIIPFLSACAVATPQPKLELDAGTTRLPGIVLLLSNLEDYDLFRAFVSRGRQRSLGYAYIDVGTSSHNLFLEGLARLFDKAIATHIETPEQDFNYELIPSVTYSAHHVWEYEHLISCTAKVRYGALLRHRDGKLGEFDSGWVEESYEPQWNTLRLVLSPLYMAIALLPNLTGWDNHLTRCYSTAFARAEERAFQALAQKISNSHFSVSSVDNQNLPQETAPNEWAIRHADSRIKLAWLIDALQEEVSANQPRKKIFVGPFVSTNEQFDARFTTYVQNEIFRSMYRRFPRQFVTPSDLYWPLDRHGMRSSDINSIDRARELALDTHADSLLLVTFTTEEPWIKVQLSLRDLMSDTESASIETKLYKDVAIRTMLEKK
jgi:hypothetical protein